MLSKRTGCTYLQCPKVHGENFLTPKPYMYILHEDLTVLFRGSALSPKPSLGGCYGNTTSTLDCSTFLWFTACLSFAIPHHEIRYPKHVATTTGVK